MEFDSRAVGGTDWSREEVAAAVADYLRMLRLELAGQSYNKSVHRRALQAQLNGRTEASIERKHRNISAVLAQLGVMSIRGYKPLFNYQRLLVEEIEEALARDRNLDAAAMSAVTQIAEKPLITSFDGFVIPPPKIATRAEEPREEWGLRQGIRRDYLQREAYNQSLGLAGELTALEFEVARLSNAGKRQLANKVEHCSKSRGDGLGYDILSFDLDGRERFIEVKTTSFGVGTPFFISDGERRFSSYHADQFHLYRLFEFRESPKMYVLPGSIEASCHLDPITYRAVPASR